MFLKYSVGIDIASKSFHATIVSIDNMQRVKVVGSRKFENTNSGFRAFKDWSLKKHKDVSIPMLFCMEATGVYHENLAHYLHEQNFVVSIVLANLSHKYLASLGMKTKNDTIDSKGLAQMGAERNLKVWNPPLQFYVDLRSLTRHHQNLQESKTLMTNKLHALEASAYSTKLVIKQLKQSLRLIDKQLKLLRNQISLHIDQDSNVRRKTDQICNIKGVGELTVAVILSETFGFELFNNAKQLVSFAGYDVVENQSGNRVGKTRISKRGNSRIRRSLFMPAFNVVKAKQEVFYNLYIRTLDQHGIKMKSYVAVQKKLLSTIYALWKKDEEFDSNYYNQLKKQFEKKSKKVVPLKVELHQVQHL